MIFVKSFLHFRMALLKKWQQSRLLPFIVEWVVLQEMDAGGKIV
jgi:hypothetical protein